MPEFCAQTQRATHASVRGCCFDQVRSSTIMNSALCSLIKIKKKANIHQNRLATSIPSSCHESTRYTHNSHNHAIRTLQVHQNAIRIMQRRSNHATARRQYLQGTPLRLCIHRRYTSSLGNQGATYRSRRHGSQIARRKQPCHQHRQVSVRSAEPTINFLGHKVSSEGYSPPQSKVEALMAIQPPKTAKQLKGFLVAMNFYRRFIPNTVPAQRRLSTLIEGNRKNDRRIIEWTPDALDAFNECKQL